MPVPKSRDPELARRDLEHWLAARLPSVEPLRITRFDMPRTSGFSNETMVVDVRTTTVDGVQDHHLVARVAPAAYRLFPDYDLTTQRRVLEALAPSAVPVPRVRWHGTAEESPFGQEFFVMDRIDGRAADDLPPYTKRGWLFDSTSDDQRRAYVDGLRQLVAVAGVDWAGLGLGFLSDDRLGPPGLAQELAYWAEFLDWVVGDRPIAPLLDTFAWLRANAPDAGPLCLSWGDSRPGNILFADHRAVAVLDWEMACLCAREADLGWWLAYQVVATIGHGLAELPGFPARDEAIGIYEELSATSVHDMHWWEVFAAFRLGVIFVRLGDMMTAVGLLPAGAPAIEAPVFRTIEWYRSSR